MHCEPSTCFIFILCTGFNPILGFLHPYQNNFHWKTKKLQKQPQNEVINNDNIFCQNGYNIKKQSYSKMKFFLKLARYGPKENMPRDMDGKFFEAQEEWEEENKDRITMQNKEFPKLIEEIISTKDPNELPSVMSKRMDLLLSMRGFEGVNLLKEAIEEANETDDEERISSVTAACDYILSFTEEFVNQARMMDDSNKKLLGKIIQAIAEKSKDSTDYQREKDLDLLLEQERDNFTPGFLRHIERECRRVEEAPQKSRESEKLLQTLRIIQTRVIDELGKDLGEGAQILGQLLGYDDRDERIGVLEAGLMVRDIDFAKEMLSLTEEALEGFKEIPKSNLDPELVERVEDIQSCIVNFIDEQSSWE